MSNAIDSFGSQERPWRIPEDDLARQAIPSLRGYIYQLHLSAASWIHLKKDDLLHLEVAEDFSRIIRKPDSIDEILAATQVKDTRESGAVTLNSSDVLVAIESLFRLQEENKGRDVFLTFLTTSEIGIERVRRLRSGNAGLVAWQKAAEGEDVSEIRNALLERFIERGKFRTFLETSSDEEFRDRLLVALTFVCGAGDWKVIEAKCRADLVAMRDEYRATVIMAERAYDAVLTQVMRTLLASETRELDRQQLIACLEGATSMDVPSQVVADWLASTTVKVDNAAPLDISDLRKLARTLLDVGAPSDFSVLFPDASLAAQSALREIAVTKRTALKKSSNANDAMQRVEIFDLTAVPSKRNLIVGLPGSGKTHALWQAAERLLREGDIVPLFLPLGGLSTWEQVRQAISECRPGIDVEAVISDARVCLFLDGWSEFAIGEAFSEKSKALRALRNSRVLANARNSEDSSAYFEVWEIELLSPQEVLRSIDEANPGMLAPSGELVDLLRVPMLLSLYILSDGRASATGELLRRFHEHLSRNLPEAFTEALSGSVAALTLANERSFGRLIAELKARAKLRGVVEPGKLLEKLGTISNRGGQAAPVHDLYWSWLCGCGLLLEDKMDDAVILLRTRESFRLALQSGLLAESASVEKASPCDLPLAAELEASIGAQNMPPTLSSAIENGFQSPMLVVRERAAVAGLKSRRAQYFRRSLDVLNELISKNLFQLDFLDSLQVGDLYAHRGELATWLGGPASSYLIDFIAEKGGPEWCLWLGQMASAGKLSPTRALAAALACGTDIPAWGHAHLEELLKSEPWLLRPAARRRLNLPLAWRIAVDYERLVTEPAVRSSSIWIDINRVLVGCGNDDCFNELLKRFSGMSPGAQELLGYAVVEKGGRWVSRFQRIAFASTAGSQHHKLAETVSLDIDDETARLWIAAGNFENGWRVLLKRNGKALASELVGALPETFDGLHDIKPLACLQYMDDAPEILIEELWGRVRGHMQPKAMQDVLLALAKVEPNGVASIVRFIINHPGSLPSYHLSLALRLYRDWEKKFEMAVMVEFGGVNMSFPQWAIVSGLRLGKDQHFMSTMLSRAGDIAGPIILRELKDDRGRLEAVLNNLEGLSTYDQELFRWMITTPKLAKLIPKVFSQCLNEFPLDSLKLLIDSTDVDQESLLLKLSDTSNPLHRPVHEELVRRVLSEGVNLWHYRYVAKMLRCYSRYEVLNMLKELASIREEESIRLIRCIGDARGELMIREDGVILE